MGGAITRHSCVLAAILACIAELNYLALSRAPGASMNLLSMAIVLLIYDLS